MDPFSRLRDRTLLLVGFAGSLLRGSKDALARFGHGLQLRKCAGRGRLETIPDREGEGGAIVSVLRPE